MNANTCSNDRMLDEEVNEELDSFLQREQARKKRERTLGVRLASLLCVFLLSSCLRESTFALFPSSSGAVTCRCSAFRCVPFSGVIVSPSLYPFPAVMYQGWRRIRGRFPHCRAAEPPHTQVRCASTLTHTHSPHTTHHSLFPSLSLPPLSLPSLSLPPPPRT
jgi:hypothetical protein